MADDSSNEDVSQPTKRTGHVAVAYRSYMLVWGGYKENDNDNTSRYLPGSELWVYDPMMQSWLLKRCRGQPPPGTSGAVAIVHHDYLYIFGGYRDEGNTNDLFRLNLQSLLWERLEPSGLAPTPADKMVGWQHGNRLYFFGGFGLVPSPGSARQPNFTFVPDVSIPWYNRRGWNNQLVSFDVHTNNWSWPQYKGEVPAARAAHAATLIRSRVFIFGGRHQQLRMNDLHMLDLENMTWSGRLPVKGQQPVGRSWHSLTAVSSDHLVLYGGFSQGNQPLSDCWLFHIPSLSWSRVELPFEKPRLWHTACINIFNEILIYGGCTENILDHDIIAKHAGDIIVLRFTPKSLFRICLDSMIHYREVLQSHWWNLPCTVQGVLRLWLQESRRTGLAGS